MKPESKEDSGNYRITSGNIDSRIISKLSVNSKKGVANISAENYRFMGNVLTDFKKGTLGHNEAIYLITENYEQIIRSEKKKSELETLELISNDQGWEESRDIYAEKLGLPKKYNLK